ncbi:MAG: lipoate--protein ligase [Oscillospiraceae bacterium]
MVQKAKVYITECTNPYTNIATEEYLTDNIQNGEIVMFLWRNRRTVVIGRNQNAFAEVNVEALREDGGFLARRLSGGGAVFHDLGNLNFTFCARTPIYDVRKQLNVIISALNTLGINATLSGRNDICVNDKKISGNAVYSHGDRHCHHGTLLIDVSERDMAKYLQVSRKKLESNGVASVRARVCNMSDIAAGLSAGSIAKALEKEFFKEYGGVHIILKKKDFEIEAIRARAEQLASYTWCFGKSLSFDCTFDERFDFGGLSLNLCVVKGLITDARAFSDALFPQFCERLAASLVGVRFSREDVKSAIGALAPNSAEDEKIKCAALLLADKNMT